MASDRAPHPPLDPAAYGEAFADVYDDWYRDLGDPELVVRALDRHRSVSSDAPSLARSTTQNGTVVELGVGTGRLAVPLAEAGWQVAGIDSSPAMLAALEQRVERAVVDGSLRTGRVTARLGDVAAAEAWEDLRQHLVPRDQIGHPGPEDGRSGPAEPGGDGWVDVVLASFNLLLNLPDDAAQALTVRHAARALRPGGVLVCETQVLDLTGVPAASVTVRSDGVRIETSVDARAGIVSGRHVDPASGVVRPWRLCALDPERLDTMAIEAGLTVEGRWSGWERSPFVPDDSPTSISIYRRPMA